MRWGCVVLGTDDTCTICCSNQKSIFVVVGSGWRILHGHGNRLQAENFNANFPSHLREDYHNHWFYFFSVLLLPPQTGSLNILLREPSAHTHTFDPEQYRCNGRRTGNGHTGKVLTKKTKVTVPERTNFGQRSLQKSQHWKFWCFFFFLLLLKNTRTHNVTRCDSIRCLQETAAAAGDRFSGWLVLTCVVCVDEPGGSKESGREREQTLHAAARGRGERNGSLVVFEPVRGVLREMGGKQEGGLEIWFLDKKKKFKVAIFSLLSVSEIFQQKIK